jgi:hypothetical protein
MPVKLVVNSAKSKETFDLAGNVDETAAAIKKAMDDGGGLVISLEQGTLVLNCAQVTTVVLYIEPGTMGMH